MIQHNKNITQIQTNNNFWNYVDNFCCYHKWQEIYFNNYKHKSIKNYKRNNSQLDKYFDIFQDKSF